MFPKQIGKICKFSKHIWANVVQLLSHGKCTTSSCLSAWGSLIIGHLSQTNLHEDRQSHTTYKLQYRLQNVRADRRKKNYSIKPVSQNKYFTLQDAWKHFNQKHTKHRQNIWKQILFNIFLWTSRPELLFTPFLVCQPISTQLPEINIKSL